MATILVVDDDAMNRKLLLAVLSGDGYLTLEASDGVDGLRVARARRPQLIISDILMPSMDGYGFVQALRNDAMLSSTPVIFCTAQFHQGEAHKLAAACGVMRVLVKPAPAVEILKAVEQVLAGVVETDLDPVPDNFDREHLRLITDTLSDRVTALGASNARFAAFADLNLDIVTQIDRGGLLDKGCRGARNLLGARFAVLAVSEKSRGAAGLFATSGIDFADSPPAPPVVNAEPLGALLVSREPWRAGGVNEGLIDLGLPGGYPPADAVLAVPIATTARAYGWLCLIDKLGADAFSEDDEKLLSILGAHIAQTYENLTLHRVLRRYADRRRGRKHSPHTVSNPG